MRGDIPQAAFRLLNTLPVHTHERPEYRRSEGSGARSSRAVKININGEIYPSFTAAMRAMHIGDFKLKTMIRNGEAKIVK